MFDVTKRIATSIWWKGIIIVCLALSLKELASQVSQILPVSPSLDQCNSILPILSEPHTSMAETMGGITAAYCKIIDGLGVLSFAIVALTILGLAWDLLNSEVNSKGS